MPVRSSDGMITRIPHAPTGLWLGPLVRRFTMNCVAAQNETRGA